MSDLNLTEIGTGESIINYTDHNTNYSSIETTVNNHMNDVSDFHNASGIVNDSGVTGANVDDALDELEDQIEAISSSANALIGAFSVTASGTNTYTGTFVDLTYFTDLKVLVTIPNSNTSQTVTLNINALGAKSIKYYDNDGNKQDPSIGMLKQNKSYLVQYDGTDFVLLTNAQAEIEAIEDRGVPFPIDEWIGEGTKTIWANNKDGTWEDNEWSDTYAGTYTPNQATKKVGTFSAKASVSVSYGGIKLESVVNLSTFEDGSASTTSDKIQWAIYIETAEIAKMAAGSDITIRFICDSSPTQNNLFAYEGMSKAVLANGWNFFEVAKSAFTSVGSPDWANVKGISLFYHSATPPTSEMWWAIDAIQMVSASGAFQRAGSADYTINSGTWYVGWDEAYKSNVVREFANVQDIDALIGTKAYSSNFTVEFNLLEYSGTRSAFYGWYKDATNYILCYCNNPTSFNLWIYDSTGSNTYTATIDSIVAGDNKAIKITRTGTEVIATLKINGKEVATLAEDTDTTGDGYACIGTRVGYFDTILDFGITTTERASQAGWSAKTDDITSRKQGNNLDNALSQMEGEGLTEAVRKWNYLHNTNTHDDLHFQTEGNWTSGAGTQSADSTNVIWGDYSLKILENDNTGSFLYSKIDSITLDLTKSINGISIGDDGYVRFIFYVSDANAIDTGTGIQLRFSQDATYTNANIKYYDVTSGIATGWNYLAIAKSAFSTNGTGAWSGIQSIRVGWQSLDNYQNEYVSFQLIQLVRIDPDDSTQYSYFQKQIADGVWENVWTWAGTNEYILGEENGAVRFKDLGTAADVNAMINSTVYSLNNDFEISTTIEITDVGDSFMFGWYVNGTNYVRVYMNGNMLYLNTVLAGSSTITSAANTDPIGSIVNIRLVKTGIVWSVYLSTNGLTNSNVPLAQKVDFAGLSGVLFMGGIIGNPCYIESATITSTKVANFANTSQNSKFLDNGILPYITTFTFGTATPITNIVTNFRYSVSEQGICKGWAYYKADDGQNASSLTISLPVAPKNNGNTNMPCVSQEKVNATWTNPLAYIDDSGSIIEFRSFSTATTGQAFIISVFFEYEIE
jgi:hypothetical protein